MANGLTNSAKQMFLKGQMAEADTYKIILMQSSYVFNKDTHHAYADVLASEHANGNGYTTGGAVLAGLAFAEDTDRDLASMSWTDARWDAVGGTLISSGAIIYNDSTDAAGGDDHTDAIVAYIDAQGTIIAPDGEPLLVQNIVIEFR